MTYYTVIDGLLKQADEVAEYIRGSEQGTYMSGTLRDVADALRAERAARVADAARLAVVNEAYDHVCNRATVLCIERDAARRALAAEQSAHADTERRLRDALASERAELAARVADVARLETSSRVMREEFDRMCEALQKHVGGEGLGGEWYPDLVARVVEERDRLRDGPKPTGAKAIAELGTDGRFHPIQSVPMSPFELADWDEAGEDDGDT